MFISETAIINNQNNPDKSYTERRAIHEPCGYSLHLISSFDIKENKHSFHRGKDRIKKFCKEIKELSTKIVNSKKKDMDLITPEEQGYDDLQKICYICKRPFIFDKGKENYKKLQKS